VCSGKLVYEAGKFIGNATALNEGTTMAAARLHRLARKGPAQWGDNQGWPNYASVEFR